MPHRRKPILVVEDDPDLRAELVEQIGAQEGLHATGAVSIADAMVKVEAVDPHLIVLDLNLPDGHGVQFCSHLRQRGVSTPIVMLTANKDDQTVVAALDAGANDYVTKPFKFSVLMARIRAHLRTYESSEDVVYRVGPFLFRPAQKALVSDSGVKTRLTEKEVNILRYLYRAGDKPVPREELLRDVWGYNSGVSTHTLETHIYRLRQKIEVDAAAPAILLTASGGYRLAP